MQIKITYTIAALEKIAVYTLRALLKTCAKHTLGGTGFRL